MNLMVSLYVPSEGRYYDFDGTLHGVDRFSAPLQNAAPGAPAAAGIQDVQQAVAQKPDPVAAGRPDIEVQLPLSGRVFLMCGYCSWYLSQRLFPPWAG